MTATTARAGCDALVIGGGFYGSTLAAHLARRLRRVVLLERGNALLTRASLANQARVHAGYHYPRSIMTALRSAVNFTRFARDYSECIDTSFTKIYAIARDSKVTAAQFVAVCEEIGAPIREARPEHAALLATWLTEQVFETREYAFDASALARRAAADMERAGVDVRLQTTAARIEAAPDDRVDVLLEPDGHRIRADHVFCATYAQTNTLLHHSGLPLLPLKNELAEIVLLRVPDVLQHLGVTVMDGPFFSVMPFPARHVHSIHHVRYSPHHHWYDLESWRDAYAHLETLQPVSRWPYMQADASRWLPALQQARAMETLFEVKTVLMQNEVDDGRPILFRPHHGLRNVSVGTGREDRQHLRHARGARAVRPLSVVLVSDSETTRVQRTIDGGLNAEMVITVAAPVTARDGPIIEAFVVDTIAVMSTTFSYWELLLVDHGTDDGLIAPIEALQQRLPNIRLVRLSRAHDEEVAMLAALECSIGDFVVLMDTDRDPPQRIPDMIRACAAGYDAVVGTTADKGGRSLPRRWMSRRFYALLGRLTGHRIDPGATNFRAFSRRIVNSLVRIKERNPYLKYLTDTSASGRRSCPMSESAAAAGRPTWAGWNSSTRPSASSSPTPTSPCDGSR